MSKIITQNQIDMINQELIMINVPIQTAMKIQKLLAELPDAKDSK